MIKKPSVKNTIVIFALSIIVSINLQAQEIKEENTKINLTTQGSIFIDDFTRDIEYSKIATGIIFIDEENVSQFLFEYSKINRRLSANNINTKLLVEVEYFKSYLSEEILQHNFLLGTTANINYTFTKEFKSRPQTNTYMETEKCFCIGGGLKAMYILSLFKDTKLIFSADINLFDFGIAHFYISDPSINFFNQDQYEFEFKLLRRRFGLDCGIAF